jgi:hypothetical protein
MAKSTLQDWQRTVETGLREWMANAEIPLDLVMVLAGETRKYLEAVALCLGAPAAQPKQRVDPARKTGGDRKSRGGRAEKGKYPPKRIGSRAEVLVPIVLNAGKDMRVLEVQRIAAEAGHDMSASQVSTVLKRAADRGVLTFKKSGKNFLYRAAQPTGGQLPLKEGGSVQASDG